MIRRLISALFGWGRVSTAPNDTGPIQTLQVRLSEYETQDGRQVMGLYGVISCPPIGADVLLIYPGGNRTNGIAIGHNHQQHRFTGAQPGEAGIGNPVAGTWILCRANGDVWVHPASGNVQVDGTITATDFVTTGGVRLSDHKHGGVQAGSSLTQGPQG
jgi:phage baseplate assembly protein V